MKKKVTDMSTTQRNYAMKKAETLYWRKENTFGCVTKKSTLNEVMVEMVLNKKVKLRPKASILRKAKAVDAQGYSAMGLQDLYDFSKLMAAKKKERKANSDKENKRIEALKTELHRVQDEIMLGDAEGAIELLKAFAAFKV